MIDVDFVSNSRGDWLAHVSAEDVSSIPDRLEMRPDGAFLWSGEQAMTISDFGPAMFLALLPSLAEKGTIIVALMRGNDLLDAVQIPVVVSNGHE